MFSVTKTFLNSLPLWTRKVLVTNSGMIVERRAHVLMGFGSPPRSWASTFLGSLASTYGPFFSERLMGYLVLPRMMSLVDSLRRLRVLPPLASTPHGDTGSRPPARRPSPPPIGWETGFMALPRTVGRI